MRVISLNLNGIRSGARKGFFDWLGGQGADLVCVQEVRCRATDLDEALARPRGLHGHFHFAERPGYGGVGVYSRLPPATVTTGIGVQEFDAEGRYLLAGFRGLDVVSVYFPSGSSSETRQAAKFRFLEAFLPVLKAHAASGREVIVCGDWNIAHREIDLKNWRGNRKHSGFLPEERAWLSGVFEAAGFVDVFRALVPDPGHYTWWSNRGRAWENNVGWRIDYQIATPGVAATAVRAEIFKDARFSDHAPLTIDYAFELTA